MVSNLVDDPIPDVMIKVREKLATPPPTIEECKDAKEVNWNAFTSTWLSVSAKNIDIRYVIHPFQINIWPFLFFQSFSRSVFQFGLSQD